MRGNIPQEPQPTLLKRDSFARHAHSPIRVNSMGQHPLHAAHSAYAGTPLHLHKVPAGFPSPADDYIERYLYLNTEYFKHPAATFIVVAVGESMTDVGIFDGDRLLVDKSVEATDGSIVIAALDGELTVKRLSTKGGNVQLLPANSQFQPIDINEEAELIIWGVVTLVLHRPV